MSIKVAAPHRASLMARQLRGRPVLAAAVALTLGAGVASAATWSGPTRRHLVTSGAGVGARLVVADVSQPSGVSPLSAGAPPGALTLGVEPARVAHPVLVTAALVNSLTVNGIPAVALNAYRVAAARIDTALPSCGIDWSLVAAIGRVESDHGRFGGAALKPDGTSTPKIIGPALNGAGFAFIADTDHGVLDGDPVYDRAVGPMQFIPSTWAGYAIDGNGDRSASPFDIHDASLAAAHYLCQAGGDLRTAAGQRSAVLAYNYSDAYLAEVLALARSYATGTPLTAPIAGSTTGSVPAPTGDPHAPAAPGPAPAAYPSHQAVRPAAATHASSASKRHPSPRTTTGGSVPAPAEPTAPTQPAAPGAPTPIPVPLAGMTLPASGPTGPTVPLPSPSASVPPCLPLQLICH